MIQHQYKPSSHSLKETIDQACDIKSLEAEMIISQAMNKIPVSSHERVSAIKTLIGVHVDVTIHPF